MIGQGDELRFHVSTQAGVVRQSRAPPRLGPARRP
ncbi:MAG: hypothetical protein R2736_04015 [Solirubrobacterales bacterium]